MSKKPQSKDEALEALDFIVNVLKEHEKDLDRLISELGNVAEQLGETGEISGKVERVEEKIGNLQNLVTNMLDYIAKQKSNVTASSNVEAKNQAVPVPAPASPFSASVSASTPVFAPAMPSGSSVILRCKQWDDFQALAHQAQTLSFTYKEAEHVFQADALKGNQVVTYSGELPELTALLKIWLSKQLEVPEVRVLEGVLTIS